MQKSLRILLTELVDYAGLFPPAGLDMPTAVRNYADYLAGEQAWALGRFVLPMAQLPAFAAAWTQLPAQAQRPCALSVLSSTPVADLPKIAAHNAADLQTAHIDCIEAKANTVGEIAALAQACAGSGLAVFVEIPLVPDPTPLIAALAEHGLSAKMRTGGVVQAAFPAPNDVLWFMQGCIERNVLFKATAGLHHPIRGDYRLTYEPNCAAGTMYGYVNVFLAAAMLAQDPDAYAPVAAAVLLDEDATAFRFAEGGVTWRGNFVSCEQLASLRQHIARSFGSCSFTEPTAEANVFM
ncbi:MAG: hypothetical protein KIH69_021745 [Anaerolineae bacterium]|nr:hypothetical protein [Anaerolineae bacterium]